MAAEPPPRLPQPRLPQQRKRRTSEGNQATYGALIGLCLVGFGFLAVVMLVLPFRGLAFVLLGTIAFFALHYVIWGRLLTKLREQDDANTDDG